MVVVILNHPCGDINPQHHPKRKSESDSKKGREKIPPFFLSVGFLRKQNQLFRLKTV